MAKVGVALTKGLTGAPPPFTAAPMDTDLPPEAIASKDAAGQVSGAGTAVKAPASASTDDHHWVEPHAFKSLVGRGHADFSSGHQQVISAPACTSNPFAAVDIRLAAPACHTIPPNCVITTTLRKLDTLQVCLTAVSMPLQLL